MVQLSGHNVKWNADWFKWLAWTEGGVYHKNEERPLCLQDHQITNIRVAHITGCSMYLSHGHRWQHTAAYVDVGLYGFVLHYDARTSTWCKKECSA